MPQFSKSSLEKLNTCEAKLQILFKHIVTNYDCTILVGHRTEEEQELAYSENRSKKHWPDSNHNKIPSRAVDVSPYPVPKKWGDGDRNEYEKFRYFAFYVAGVADTLGIPIRWGGDWDSDHDVNDQYFNDLVHFELNE